MDPAGSRPPLRRVVVDASAMAAVTFQEPGFERVAAQLEDATVFAPPLLKYELMNTAWKKARRHPQDATAFFVALSLVVNGNIVWNDVDAVDVALVALSTGLTTYDASYLWLAGTLGADLVTLDARLARFGEAS
jgi:predicted nucleic acid-binding protein